ncbi:hypothetical protein AnigIFM62618_005305 [Aspergillus niger]|nr:hypothetical protein AnigIFM62618_005305 [Aspergillus niger]
MSAIFTSYEAIAHQEVTTPGSANPKFIRTRSNPPENYQHLVSISDSAAKYQQTPAGYPECTMAAGNGTVPYSSQIPSGKTGSDSTSDLEDSDDETAYSPNVSIVHEYEKEARYGVFDIEEVGETGVPSSGYHGDPDVLGEMEWQAWNPFQ